MYEINKERLAESKGKLCPCFVDNEINNKPENYCPCDKFIQEDECRCGIFKKIEVKRK